MERAGYEEIVINHQGGHNVEGLPGGHNPTTTSAVTTVANIPTTHHIIVSEREIIDEKGQICQIITHHGPDDHHAIHYETMHPAAEEEVGYR